MVIPRSGWGCKGFDGELWGKEREPRMSSHLVKNGGKNIDADLKAFKSAVVLGDHVDAFFASLVTEPAMAMANS